MPELKIEVYGVPAPGGSKRGFIRGGHVVITDACKRNKPWRETVLWSARKAMEEQGWVKPVERSISVTVCFYMPRPAGHFGSGKNAGVLKPSAPESPFRKPDLTKLWRSTEDALTDAGCWGDDAMIVTQTVSKAYVWAERPEPGATIRVGA
jgi:crossover junction endodeoxyribonuclease RusA